MKLADILANIDAMVSRSNSGPIKHYDPITEIFTVYVIKKIKTILKSQIGGNPTQALDPKSAEPLIAIIKEVYEIIAGSDLVPPHNPYNLLTTILLSLSKQL